MDSLPDKLSPIVQIVDNFSRNHRLAAVTEFRVGDARIIVCSIDLTTDLENRPVARQLRHSLINYMQSGAFAPSTSIALEQFKSLFKKANPMVRAKVVSITSSQDGYPASNMFDGNPSTMWHSAWSPERMTHPHEMVIDLGREMILKGFSYLPRQDKNPNGTIKDYEFYVGADGQSWGEPVARGTFKEGDALKQVSFYDALSVYSDTEIKGRFIRLVIKSGFGSDSYGAIAELAVIP